MADLKTATNVQDQASPKLPVPAESLRVIVDSIPGIVSTLNAAGEVEFVNRPSLEYTGKTSEESKNWATSDLVHPDDLPRMMDSWRRVIETGQPLDHEIRNRRADAFLPHTIQMGSYFGIRASDGRLVAMAGERLQSTAFTEISAVCTHPEFRGRGYARGPHDVSRSSDFGGGKDSFSSGQV